MSATLSRNFVRDRERSLQARIFLRTSAQTALCDAINLNAPTNGRTAAIHVADNLCGAPHVSHDSMQWPTSSVCVAHEVPEKKSFPENTFAPRMPSPDADASRRRLRAGHRAALCAMADRKILVAGVDSGKNRD